MCDLSLGGKEITTQGLWGISGTCSWHFNSKSDLEKCADNARILDVFLEDLPRLPLGRELEFGTDLLPGSTPISVPSYKMALTELKELQL